MPSNVRVAVRVRPLLPHEMSSGHQQTLLDVNSSNNQIAICQDSQEDNSKIVRKVFKFDKIIDQQYTQQEVFEQLQIQGLIGKVMEGFHATIFAYGQTGSGKTYTMEGYKYEEAKQNERAGRAVISENLDNGITIRSIREIFKQAEEMKKEKHITVSCSFLQIYNEKVYDLLNASQLKKAGGAKDQGLRIRWNKNDQFTVENLYVFKCDSPEYALMLYNKGVKNKVIASHNLNHASSRSHCIFTLSIDIVDNSAVDNLIVSKLQLVDLAGSERQSATGTTGLAQKESIDINKSLFTLRQVITSLAEGARGGKKAASLQHIPYRDSKLTCLLKQSIGGNSYCLMIACLSPSDAFVEENLSTLTYATKASFISNEPTKNEDPKMKMINELKQKVVSLQKELAQANNHIQFLSNLTGQPVSETIIAPVQKQGSSLESQGGTSLDLQRQDSGTPQLMQANVEIKMKPTTEVIAKQHSMGSQKQQQAAAQELETFHRLDHNQLSQRLIESVAMVKELMQSNKQYRDTIDQLSNDVERYDGDLYHLQMENRDLRDRIEILESVIATSTQQSEFDALDWRALLLTDMQQEQDTKSPSTTITSAFRSSQGSSAISEIATELVEQRKANRAMQEEMEMLRTQMQEMRLAQENQLPASAGVRQSQQIKSQQSQQYSKEQMISIYSSDNKKVQQQYKHMPSAPPMSQTQQQMLVSPYAPPQQTQQHQQPKSKQEALKMLNDMMNKRVENRQQRQ